MSDPIGLVLKAAFVENMPLTLFLGLCTFMALSRSVGTAIGLGIAVTASLGVTAALNQAIYQFLLAPGAWAWAGMPDLDLSYLKLIAFIGVIAASIQLIEMVMDRFFPAIYASFGVFLPLLTVHCAILAGSLLAVDRHYDIMESFVYGLAGGFGFAIAVVMLAGIRQRMAYADLPGGLRGLGITFILAGMMSLGFSAFALMVAA